MQIIFPQKCLNSTYLRTLLVFLTFSLFNQATEAQYGIKPVPAPYLGSASINTKGQVAGIEFVDFLPVALHIWLPTADYGLEAGVYSYPVPAELNGARFSFGTKVLDFADNGVVLIADQSARGSMYFYQDEFVPLYGWSTERPDLWSPSNMSNNGIIYSFRGQYPNAAELVVSGIRTEGPGVSSQEYVGRTLRTASPGGQGELIEIEQIGKGNSSGIHISQNWIRDWGPTADVFEKRIGGIWNNRFISIEIPGEAPSWSFVDINDKNQLVGTRGGARYYYLPSGDYGKGLGFHEVPEAGANQPGFSSLTTHGELYSKGGKSFFSIPENNLYQLSSLLGVTGYTLNSIHRINDAGQLLIDGKEPDGTPKTFILEPSISATVTIEPSKVEIGETFNLDVKIKNNSEEPFILTGVLASSFKILGSAAGGLEQLENPPPSNLLAPGDTFLQRFVWKCSKSGKLRFALKAAGYFADQTENLTPEITSNELLVKPAGDLLINYGEASTSNWLGDDVYQEFPIEPQRLEKTIGFFDQTTFNLRVKNNAADSSSYLLKAVETQGAGWVVRYIGTDGTGLVDLTELIKDAGGAVFDMPGNEVLDFSIEVQSNPEATSEQVGILMTLADSANPGESLDAVEIAIMRSDTWIEVEPRYPLVGHQASVTVNFKNTTGETLTNVAPGFIVAETSIFAGGAEVELLTEDPEPPVVASVADQEEVSFVYFYRMKEEGLVDFESAVFGTKVDNSKFESTLGESERIDIGKVAVISADLVQALPKVPVVSGKATAWYVTISNTSPEAQYVSFEKILRTGGVEERKGGEWDALLPGTFSDLYSLEEEGAFSNLPPEPGEIEFVLFGDDLTVEDYFGRSATGSYEPVSTFPLGVIFVSVGFQPELGFPPVQNEIADALRMLHGQFLGQVFPMPSTELPPLGTADFYLNPGDFSEEVSQNVLTILGLAENWALLNGVTRLVTLFPEDSRIWFGNAEGAPASLSSPAFKHAPAVLGSEEVAINYPDTTASEILRTFGFSDTSNGSPPIEEGFEIFRNSAEILEELPDLMQSPKSPESWISKEQYEAMLFILLNPTPDPEVLIVSGSINQAEEVSANAWYTGFTDQVTQLQTEGVYSIKFLDDQNAIIAQHKFNSNFDLHATFTTGSTSESTIAVDTSPFVFALTRPEALAKVEITKADQVLYERTVTPNSPVIDSLTALAGTVLQPAASQPLEWTTSDADGGELESAISWSADGGIRWFPILMGSTTSSFDWTVPDQSTRTGYIRLRVTDGVNTTVRDEGPFTIEGSEPAVLVTSGGDLMVTAGKSIQLDGSGSYATDDRNLSYHWTALGWPKNGFSEILNADQATATWTPLTEGDYLFKLEASDDEGKTTSSYKRVAVSGSILLDNGSLKITPLPDGRIELRWASNLLVDLEQSGDLSPETWKALEAASEVESDERVLRLTIEEFSRFFRLRIIEDN